MSLISSSSMHFRDHLIVVFTQVYQQVLHLHSCIHGFPSIGSASTELHPRGFIYSISPSSSNLASASTMFASASPETQRRRASLDSDKEHHQRRRGGELDRSQRDRELHRRCNGQKSSLKMQRPRDLTL